MYGTRDSAQNWEYEYCESMEGIGFKRGKASPCVFHQEERGIRAVIHGDDFTLLGASEQLDWFREQTVKRFEVKFKGRIGPGIEDEKSVRVFYRKLKFFVWQFFKYNHWRSNLVPIHLVPTHFIPAPGVQLLTNYWPNLDNSHCFFQMFVLKSSKSFPQRSSKKGSLFQLMMWFFLMVTGTCTTAIFLS